MSSSLFMLLFIISLLPSLFIAFMTFFKKNRWKLSREQVCHGNDGCYYLSV